ncbi:hypothetical protein [Shinella sp. BYT-45]|uniref:hypothetical protein n=1 Tax=Shinella sp. BYT-45 TaxID=3377377 RepID=UPI00397ED8FA
MIPEISTMRIRLIRAETVASISTVSVTPLVAVPPGRRFKQEQTRAYEEEFVGQDGKKYGDAAKLRTGSVALQHSVPRRERRKPASRLPGAEDPAPVRQYFAVYSNILIETQFLDENGAEFFSCCFVDFIEDCGNCGAAAPNWGGLRAARQRPASAGGRGRGAFAAADVR